MPWTEPVTVTLPGSQIETLRATVAAGQAKSVSAWIADAVAQQLADREVAPSEHEAGSGRYWLRPPATLTAGATAAVGRPAPAPS